MARKGKGFLGGKNSSEIKHFRGRKETDVYELRVCAHEESVGRTTRGKSGRRQGKIGLFVRTTPVLDLALSHSQR